MIRNPFGITVNSETLETLKKLQPTDGGTTSSLRYADVLTPDADGLVQIGSHKVEASVIAGALDENIKAPKGAIKSLLSTAEKLEAIQATVDKQTEKINTAIARGARKAVLKSPAGKTELKFSELAELVGDTQVFNNPLGIPSSVHRIKNTSGVWYQVRLGASAVTQIGSTETKEDAQERLMNNVVNDRENLITISGLKLTDKNLSLVGHAVRPYKQDLPAGVTGIVIGYSLTFNDLNKAMRVVTKLHEAAQAGAIHVLDPVNTDPDTLRANLNAQDLLNELESEVQETDSSDSAETEETPIFTESELATPIKGEDDLV